MMSVVSVPSLVARNRWRRAYITTYGWRAFLSLYIGYLVNKVRNNTKLLRCPSYTAIDVEPNRFSSIYGVSLTELVRERNVNLLRGLGWVEGVAQALESNPENGIDGYVEDIVSRKRVFGSNAYPGPPAKRFHCFLLEAFKDPMILILLVCAALSAGFGIKNHGLWKGLYQGILKFVGVSLVAAISAGSQFWPDKHFHRLSEASYNQIMVDVNRYGQRQTISISEIVVGDAIFLKPCDQVPVDGLLSSRQNLQVDESDMMGQSNVVTVDPSLYPFLLCGTRVRDGFARMLVTSVGLNTEGEGAWKPVGHFPSEQTLLHSQLQKLTSVVGKAGQVVAFLVLLVSLVRYFTANIHYDEANILHVLIAILGILATPLMIASTAAPDGLILSFLISRVYSMKRMMDHRTVVRDLSFCRTTRPVTTICASKTGTLTSNLMEVTKFWMGLTSIEYGYNLLLPSVIELLQVGTGLNTNPPMESSFAIPSDPTEKAIFEWAIKQLGMDTQALIANWTIWKTEAFDSWERKSGVFVERKDDKTIYVHRKGAPETILANCSHYCEAYGDINPITDTARERFKQILEGMAALGLQCVAFSYKQIQEKFYLGVGWETGGWILLGLAGLQNPCAPGVKAAVNSCFKAGLDVKMITGDNVLTATAIASECGILDANQPGGGVVDGVEFENYTQKDRLKMVDNIRVMARASPFQKFLMVECLKRKGQSVAFVGHSTGDALALSEADIGLCLRHHGTVTAEHSSDMVVMDGHFASAVIALFMWDRGMLETIQIFIQFQLVANIVSLVIDSVTATSGDPPTIDFVASVSSGKVPYPALQLLWVKLIMGPLAAMALILAQSFEELIHKQPRQRTNSPMTYITWRNTSVHVLYQITILLTIHFKGKSIYNISTKVRSTLIFNVFVLCQVFNLLGARFIDKNSFKEIKRKKLFGGLIAIIIVIQAVIVEFLKSFADTTRLELGHWCTCIAIAAGSWLVGWLVNHLPARKEPFFSYRTLVSHRHL